MGKRERVVSGATSSKTSPKKASRVEIPNVSALSSLSVGGTSHAAAAFNQDVNIGVIMYCSKGSVYSPTFTDAELFVVQVASAAIPNPFFMFKRAVELFGATSAERESPVPRDLDDLVSTFKVAYQWVGKKTDDCDGVGWAKNRMGFYISGGAENVKEFLMYIDDFLAWRAHFSDDFFEEMTSLPKLVIHVCADLHLTIDKTADAMQCEFEIHEGVPDSMSVFALPSPTFPNRITVASFEMVSAEEVHVVFGGNAKPFQGDFVAKRIKGQTYKANPTDEYGEYYRMIPSLSLQDEEQASIYLQAILGDECLHSSPVILRVKESEHETFKLKKVLAKLKGCRNVSVDSDL